MSLSYFAMILFNINNLKLLTMKYFIQWIILFIFYLVSIDFVQASYCIPNPHYFNLLVEGDGIYLQKTVKDHNEISYVSQSKVRLDNITDKGTRVISDDDNNILVLSNANYYFIPKSLKFAKEDRFTPLFNENEVSKIVSNHFFLVSGDWYYASYFVSDRETYKQKIPRLKGDLKVIADFGGYKYLLKNDNTVYVYDRSDNKLEKIQHQGNLKNIGDIGDYNFLFKDDNAVYFFADRSNKLEKIPHLTPSQTHLFQSLYLDRHYHYLYDDDTFYLIKKLDIGFNYTDITKEFNLQGKYDGFAKAEIHSQTSKTGDSIDTKDGLIWLNLGDSFKPVKATYLNAYKDLYVYHDKVYIDNDDLYRFTRHEAGDPNYSDNSYREKSIDLSNVKNPSELYRPLYSVFSDNQQQYSLEENPLRLEIKDPSVDPRLTTKDHIEIKEKQIFIDGQQINTDKFQDTPIFLGSIVHITSPCNGYRRTDAEKVSYYFFTDGKKVYAYINPGKNQKPKVLNKVSPQNLKVNDYDTLKELRNIVIKP